MEQGSQGKAAPPVAGEAGRYLVGDLVMDLARERVTRDGREIELGKLSFDLLAALVRAAPELVSVDRLMQTVWPGLVVGPETVSQRIKRLRAALSDDSRSPRYINGVRGRGYRIVASVAPLIGAPLTSGPAAVPAEALPATPAALAPRTKNKWIVAGAALLLIAGAGAYLAHRAPAPPASSAAPGPSIAVMPFVNLTGDAGKEYLGDGMAEELINSLTHISGLKVPARTSSFAYKGRSADVRRIAQDLGVSTILEGSVRSAGERIRITAQLIDARSGYHIWSQNFDRGSADIFKLQDELAAAIVNALQGYLGSPLPPRHPQAPPSNDVEAYQLYLQALSVARPGTERSLRLSLGFFDRAIARDPGFARAYVERAELRTGFIAFGYPQPRALEDVEADAHKALSLDPALGKAHTELGTASAFRGHWTDAEAEYGLALAADPAEPWTHVDYAGNLLESVGRMSQALQESTAAYQLAPADSGVVVLLATAHSLMGHDADAARLAETAISLGAVPTVTPLPQILANAASRAGRFTDAAGLAVAALPEVLRKAGGIEAMQSVYAAYADPGERPAAIRSLQNLLHRLKPDQVDVNARKDLIIAFTRLGALDAAFEYAHRSLDEFTRSGMVGNNWGALWLPEMRPFRQDARFQPFVTRLGMMSYWQQYSPPDDCTLQGDTLTCN